MTRPYSALLVALALASTASRAGEPVEDEPAKEAPTEATTPLPSVATPAAAALRVLLLDLRGENVDEASVRLLDGMLPTPLQDIDGLEVISGAELRKMAELEAERAVVGCESDGSCLAELAGALGAGLAISGQVGQLGSQLVMNLQLFDAGEARVVSRVTRRVGSFEALADAVPDAVRELMAPTLAARGLSASTTAAPVAAAAKSEEGGGFLPWGVALGGVAASVVGGGLVAWTGVDFMGLTNAESQYVGAADLVVPGSTQGLVEANNRWDELQRRREAWNRFGAWALPLGVGLLVGGLGAAAGGTVWGLVGSEE